MQLKILRIGFKWWSPQMKIWKTADQKMLEASGLTKSGKTATVFYKTCKSDVVILSHVFRDYQ